MAKVPSKIRRKVEWLVRRAESGLLADAVLAGEGAHLRGAEALERLAELSAEVLALGWSDRLDQLRRALASTEGALRRAYGEQHGVCGVQRFRAGSGARIYQLAVETLPKHVNNLYLVVEGESRTLVDGGSGLETSQRDLRLGFAIVRSFFGEDVAYGDVDWCVVTHAHIDHFGGVNALKRETRAHFAVHELDARVLACFDERLVVVSKDLELYWRRAGVPDDERAKYLSMYQVTKRLFVPQEMDRLLRDGDLLGPGYRVHHVPGHCPGLICLQVHDVLLTSDHVLARTTPHQFPQCITPFAGLEHYFRSLAKVRKLEGINLALGGHEEPIWDLRARCDAIASFHRDRLARVLEICAVPSTVVAVSQGLFGPQEGYNQILALEEAGAHVEYLHDLGRLRIANLDEVAQARDPVIAYVARS